MDPFLHREPVVVDGFPEDFQEVFEDFIDNFVPLSSIVKICKVDYGMEERDLSYFCQKAYNMDFRTTYEYLHTRADMYMRKSFTQLSKAGNKTAMQIASDYFTEWSKDKNKQELKITIDAGVPKDE